MCPMTLAAKQMSAARFGLWSDHSVDRQYRHAAVVEPWPLSSSIGDGGRDSDLRRLRRGGCCAVFALVPKQPAAHADESSPLSQMAEVLRIGLSRPLRGLIALSLVSLAASLVLRGLWGGPWLMEIKALSRIEAGNTLGLFTLAMIAGPVLMGILDRSIGHRREILAATHSLAALLLALMAAGAPHYPASGCSGLRPCRHISTPCCWC